MPIETPKRSSWGAGEGVAQVVTGEVRLLGELDLGDVSGRRVLRAPGRGEEVERVGRLEGEWVGEVAVEDRRTVPQSVEDIEWDSIHVGRAVGLWPERGCASGRYGRLAGTGLRFDRDAQRPRLRSSCRDRSTGGEQPSHEGKRQHHASAGSVAATEWPPRSATAQSSPRSCEKAGAHHVLASRGWEPATCRPRRRCPAKGSWHPTDS